MKPVVSMSMSPESFSSGVSAAIDVLGAAGGAYLKDGSLLGSWAIPFFFRVGSLALLRSAMNYATEPTRSTLRFALEFSSQASFWNRASHVDGRPRRLHLARRQARALARGDHPRPHPLPALRPRRVRRRTRLQDGGRHRDLPPEGTHHPDDELRQDLHDGAPLFARPANAGPEESRAR